MASACGAIIATLLCATAMSAEHDCEVLLHAAGAFKKIHAAVGGSLLLGHWHILPDTPGSTAIASAQNCQWIMGRILDPTESGYGVEVPCPFCRIPYA